MIFSLLIVVIASSAIECSKKSEICPCVPLNICPEINKFNKEDAKYFATVLKCKEVGFVRCCSNNEEKFNTALRRSDDDVENTILIDDYSSKEIDGVDHTTEVNDFEATTINTELRSLESDLQTTTESFDGEVTTSEEGLETTTESERQPKLIDNSISVVYPNQNNSLSDEDKKNEIMEHLFLIFPNGEIEAAMATSTQQSVESTKRPRRVVVRKRLIKKTLKTRDSFEGAESKISEAVVEPKPMDIDEVKKRITSMLSKKRRKNDLLTTTPTTTTISTTESPVVEETTIKKKRKKKIKV